MPGWQTTHGAGRWQQAAMQARPLFGQPWHAAPGQLRLVLRLPRAQLMHAVKSVQGRELAVQVVVSARLALRCMQGKQGDHGAVLRKPGNRSLHTSVTWRRRRRRRSSNSSALWLLAPALPGTGCAALPAGARHWVQSAPPPHAPLGPNPAPPLQRCKGSWRCKPCQRGQASSGAPSSTHAVTHDAVPSGASQRAAHHCRSCF